MTERQQTDETDGTRRELLKGVAALATGALVSTQVPADAQEAPIDTLRFFPGFAADKVQTSGATINLVKGGSGPPLLLMHGAPQSHISWRLVAQELAKHYTVIATDLRGYGDSSKPDGGENHVDYAKRAMALDQVEVMQHFGFDRFAVLGHDRGGRVGHRMALDHPKKITHLAVIDIVPTYYLYTHVNIQFVQAYYHWFSYLRRAPIPENELIAQNEARRARATSDVQREYLRTAGDPANIHAMCEDYRAGASIDLEHDAADIHKKIACPLLVLWGERGAMGRIFDVLGIWKERGKHVSGKSLPGGHTLQEDVPEQFLAEVLPFLKT